MDAQSHYQEMSRYYIALFGDSKVHGKRITAMNTEFANAATVRVVGPEFLCKFIDLDTPEIEGVYRRLTKPSTWTHEKAALNDAADYADNDDLYFALACMFYYFDNSTNCIPESFFQDDERLIERFDHQQVADLRGAHLDGLFEMWASRDDIQIRTEMFTGIEAMYRSLRSQHDWHSDSLFAYMFSFLKKPATA
jgi:hypothetical protein